MQRSWYIWLAFAVCLTVVLAAMTWITLHALRLDRIEEQAIRQAAVEEKTRLALWRMDSALTPLIGQESSRPYFTYTSFHPLDRAYNRMFAELKSDDVLVPSPLLTLQSPDILLHFQVHPDGQITSPQAPQGNMRDLAENAYTSQEAIQLAEQRLDKLRGFLKPELLAALPKPANDTPYLMTMDGTSSGTFNGSSIGNWQPLPASQPAAQPQQDQQKLAINAQGQPQAAQRQKEQQQAINSIEFDRRTQSVNNASYANVQMFRPNGKGNQDNVSNVLEGQPKAFWTGPNLVLAQRVRVDGREYVQGCWLDWEHIRGWLGAKVIGDLLPHANLQPCPVRCSEQEYMLAALPVRLVPGDVPVPAFVTSGPVSMSLSIAWACLIAGAIAIAAVLHGAIRLSQRRGAFVSAVTHEMRTPLTTFRLYTDLLSQNMVVDVQKRQNYLRRLCDEAQRLSHLVENVLAFARLSGPHRGSPRETIGLGQLVERSRERLAGKAQQCGMELVVEMPDEAASANVAINVSAVEQVLMNLVDNACKYATSAADKRIHLQVEPGDGRAILRVRDHGPGLDKKHLRKLFQPFSRSAHEAAGSAPGVGLGLALSRRMARDMGGDLELERDYREGASFVLSLPKA